MINRLPDEQAGRCWACGYLLRGVESGRCPECGRAFDRADRSSINFGRPMGRVGRWMLSPLGWPLPALAIAACILICATARWPVEGWTFSTLDLHQYGDVRRWRAHLIWGTGIDATYISGLAIAVAVVAGWTARAASRAMVIMLYRPPHFQRGKFWGRSAAILLALLLTLLGVGLGWPYRLGQLWVALVSMPPSQVGMVTHTPPDLFRPDGMSPEQSLAAIRSAVLQAWSPRARVGGLKVLMETRPLGAPPTRALLTRAIEMESNAEVRALEVRLLGLLREPSCGPQLAALLGDPSSQVREAAADAVGIWRLPAFTLGPLTRRRWPARRVESDPQIELNVQAANVPTPAQTPPEATRERLENMMLAGETLAEREAAARSLLNWPALGYRLRYAEWGVFLADAEGKIELTQAQLDEIPPFAHRVGNPASEMADRIDLQMVRALKPVIHLSVDRPMAVDLEVSIRAGRPWVVYPAIDDLTVLPHVPADPEPPDLDPGAVDSGAGPLDALDLSGASVLDNLREGYPWLTPKHRAHEWGSEWGRWHGKRFARAQVIAGIGVRWQSLVVTPARQSWMNPPPVGHDPRFQWWQRLRDVDCAWVSSRGESDRFLYYDGPTKRRAAVDPAIKDRRVKTTPSIQFPFPIAGPPGRDERRHGLYVEITPAGAVRTAEAENVQSTTILDIGDLAAKSPEQAQAQFRAILLRRGLRPSEADGLLDCWRPAFFQTPGRRFLTFMSTLDYDDACPMQIRPTPTERARVGIIWTELK